MEGIQKMNGTLSEGVQNMNGTLSKTEWTALRVNVSEEG
jgi:hypothetical protein